MAGAPLHLAVLDKDFFLSLAIKVRRATYDLVKKELKDGGRPVLPYPGSPTSPPTTAQAHTWGQISEISSLRTPLSRHQRQSTALLIQFTCGSAELEISAPRTLLRPQLDAAHGTPPASSIPSRSISSV